MGLNFALVKMLHLPPIGYWGAGGGCSHIMSWLTDPHAHMSLKV